MKALIPGHRYALANLVGGGETVLQFYQDPALHNGIGADGPSCQEVLRAIIDRVQELDRERPWEGNATIIYDLRHAISGFEARALIRRVEKDGLAIEQCPLADDGHLLLAQGMSAFGQDREAGLEAKPASPVAESDAPKDQPEYGADPAFGPSDPSHSSVSRPTGFNPDERLTAKLARVLAESDGLREGAPEDSVRPWMRHARLAAHFFDGYYGNEIGRLRERLSAALAGGMPHRSDCSVYNAPAYEPEPCDCGAAVSAAHAIYLASRSDGRAA